MSVLMPVHPAADPDQLSEALRSIHEQSLPPDEIVIVEDGLLGGRLRSVVDEVRSSVPVRRVVIEISAGLGHALQVGLDATRCPWIARMDADDVAVPDRLATQMALADHTLDVIGGAALEFDGDPGNVVGRRVMPSSHEDIRRMMRTANPINHPTVVFRRAAAVEAGGYRPLPGLEDYDLWARMMASGARFQNTTTVVLFYRGGAHMISRRRQSGTWLNELRLQRNLMRYGIIGASRAAGNLVLRGTFSHLPPRVTGLIYRSVFLRSPTSSRDL